jgi:hypothetical protein
VQTLHWGLPMALFGVGDMELLGWVEVLIFSKEV